MDPQVRQIEKEILRWPNVTSHSHRFGGREFRWGSAEIGHVHDGGVLDIPFPRSIRDALLEEGLAEQHRWVPDSGWTTFRVRKEGSLKHALWLLRISYLRYALKKSDAPEALFEQEAEHLGLSERFRSLLSPFVRPRAVLAIEFKPEMETQRSA
jgi:Luciferase